MVKKIVQGLIVLTALLWAAGAAQAADLLTKMQADIFVLGGGSTLINPHYFVDAGRLYHSQLDYGPKYMVGASFPYGRILSIEMSYMGGPNNLNVTNIQVYPRKGVVYPVRVYTGNLSAIIHVPYSFMHLRPYVDGGVEYDRFAPTTAAISYATNHGFASASTASLTHNNKLGVSAGFGVERKLTKRLALRVDLRDHVTSSPAFGLPPSPTSGNPVGYPVIGRGNDIAYTAGIVLHLGKL